MKELSICQEYLLCTLNNKGKFSSLNTYNPACFVASALLDLMTEKVIEVDNKNHIILKSYLNFNCQHLSSLVDYLEQKSPVKVNKLISDYTMSFSDKRLKELIKEVGSSLEKFGYITALNDKKVRFIPNEDIVKRIVQEIRTEFLEENELSTNTIALVCLLNRSKDLKKYFSKYEEKELKAKLKEIEKNPTNQFIKNIINYVDTILVSITTAYIATS